MAKLYINSDMLVNITDLTDVATGSLISAADVMKMSVFKAVPLHPNVGAAVAGVQSLVPGAPATSLLAFTSGGLYAIRAGDVIIGATGGATATVVSVEVTSGTWAGENAAGNLEVANHSTTEFQAENLNVGTDDLNVATIGAIATKRNFKLTYDEEQTADIANDATVGEIKSALDALSGVTAGDIIVSGDTFDTNPVSNGTFFTFLNTLGKVPQITVQHTNLIGPTIISENIITEGHLVGKTISETGGTSVSIPIEGHNVIKLDDVYVRLVGFLKFVGHNTLYAIERDKLIFNETYADYVETFGGDEEIYIGLGTGSFDITLTPVGGTPGAYQGTLPDALRPILRGGKYLLFVDIEEGTAKLTLVADLAAIFYSG